MDDFGPQALEPDALSSVLSLATQSCVVSLGLLLPLENGLITVSARDSRYQLPKN